MAQQYAWPNSVHGLTVCMAQQYAWPNSVPSAAGGQCCHRQAALHPAATSHSLLAQPMISPHTPDTST